MNKILNNKINSHLTRIIGLYVLPSSIPITLNTKSIMKKLISKTYEIKYDLNRNICLDSNGVWIFDLKNTKFRHIQNKYSNFWTIRKC